MKTLQFQEKLQNNLKKMGGVEYGIYVSNFGLSIETKTY